MFYRLPFVPSSWIFGSAHELQEYAQFVESGTIAPGRAIDVGCGEGSNVIYLSKCDFDVTGVDFSPTAIKRATSNAQAAGVEVTFVEDDLTNLRHVSGTFDLLVDFGALNDLNPGDRDSYMENILLLTRPCSCFILMGFTKSLPPNEVERRFGDHFNIEILTEQSGSIDPRDFIFYSMTRG